MFSVLPTLLTLGNAACGFGAITFAAKVGPANVDGNELFIAAILIFLAMLFDMLDGSAARWAKQTSDFGAQLDSLCDGVSFGVAPAFLMLQYVQSHRWAQPGAELAVEPWFRYHPRFLWVVAVLYATCALLRLARFNVETDEDDTHDSFSGLPSPAAAGTVASFLIALRELKDMAGGDDETVRNVGTWLIGAVQALLPPITFCVACLMVSRIRYAHVFNQLFRGQRSRQHVIQIVFALAAVFLVREMAVPLAFCYFAFSSPLRAAWQEVVSRRWFRSRPT
jgi:CDP-diacylglycerol--serine O-phosphatidyltransferase